MADLPLTLCAVPGEIVDPLLGGEVKPEGIELTITRTDGSTGYWRQLKFQEFDVAVMSVTSYLISRSKGTLDAVALPVFASRRFMHADLRYHVDSGVTRPEELVGKRIGVGEYQQTAAVWLRGVLEHDFGVSQYNVHWYMERTEELSHGGATGFQPPHGISFQQVPPSKSMASMLVNRELDAATIGRALRPESNLIDRSTQNRGSDGDWSRIKPLFPDRMAEGVRFFKKYGCIPATQMYLIKGDVYRKHPWIAFNMYEAFIKAKQAAQASLSRRIPSSLVFGQEYLRQTRDLLGPDPYPYGLAANRAMLETVAGFCVEQGLLTEKPRLDELFALSTVDA
jgi:4,5-dihydroxyphthalate decarboxylase